MKRFKFGLEKVLELREHREHETEIELGKAVGALNAVEHKIAEVNAERERMFTQRPQNASEIFIFDRYVLRLNDAKSTLLKEAEKASEKVAAAREVYIEASRDRKILDNLKERRYKEYRKFTAAEEIKSLDDVVNSAKARKVVNE